MANASEVSVGVSHELAITGTKVGFEPKDFATLAHSEDKMSAILGVIRGTHQITLIDHVIDLSSPARLPFNVATVATLEVHRGEGIVKLERRGDDLYLDGKKINIFLSKKQKGGSIGGHDLRKELEKRGDNVSAKVLDYLVDHPELWPESWKKDKGGNTNYVFFWDDIFRDSGGNLYVRFGCWDEGKVVSDCHWLDRGWDNNNPAASLAS